MTYEAKALSALADVWNNRGDPGQALVVEREALDLLERAPDISGRTVSHHNLAGYLDATGSPIEAQAHRMAAICYRLVTRSDISLSTPSLVRRIRESTARGETFTLPPLADLLADPAFAPLRAFVAERAIPTAGLQARIDALVTQAHAAALR